MPKRKILTDISEVQMRLNGIPKLLSWLGLFAAAEIAFHVLTGIPFVGTGILLLAAPTVLTDVLATDGGDGGAILAAQRVVNMDDMIHDLDPQATALTALLMKLRKESTFNPKLDWLEDEYAPKQDAINNGAGYASGATSLVVDNGAYFRPFDLVHVPRTLEIILVLTTSGNTLNSVTRGFGETAAAALVDNDPLWIIGNALKEGDTMPAIRTTKVSNQFNYTQIFREPVGATRTENDSRTYGGMNLGRLRRKHAVEHMMAIENAFWFGERQENLTAKPRRSTRGVMRWLLQAGSGAAAKDLAAATLDETSLDAFMQDAFRYGNQTKFFFCSRLGMTRISGIAKASNKLRMFPQDQVYGIAIYTYLSPHGTAKLIVNNLFTGAETDKRWSGWIVCLDLADLAYVYFNNADTKLYIGRQANDVDGQIDEYLTECGLKLVHPRHHGYIKNFI